MSAAPDEPDHRDFYTANKLLSERRAEPRTLWAICQTCGLQRRVHLSVLTINGHGSQPIRQLKFRCECGGLGAPKLTWINPGRRKANELIAGKPRPGSYDYATDKMVGTWD